MERRPLGVSTDHPLERSERMNCIVVESSLFQRQVLVQSAQRTGRFLKVLGAGDLEKAMSLYDGDVSLVVVGWEIPDQRAHLLVHSIRDHHQWPSTPIVVVSSRCTIGDREMATNLGASVVLARPFTPGQFASAVTFAMDERIAESA